MDLEVQDAKITININTYNKIIEILNFLWFNKINNDKDNEISNIVFELLTEDLKEINCK